MANGTPTPPWASAASSASTAHLGSLDKAKSTYNPFRLNTVLTSVVDDFSKDNALTAERPPLPGRAVPRLSWLASSSPTHCPPLSYLLGAGDVEVVEPQPASEDDQLVPRRTARHHRTPPSTPTATPSRSATRNRPPPPGPDLQLVVLVNGDVRSAPSSAAGATITTTRRRRTRPIPSVHLRSSPTPASAPSLVALPRAAGLVSLTLPGDPGLLTSAAAPAVVELRFREAFTASP